MRLIRYLCVTVGLCKMPVVVQRYALMHMIFGNDQGVRLLEHVR